MSVHTYSNIGNAGEGAAVTSKGRLFVLVGPSAVGKNTIMQGVLAATPKMRQLPTMTTRPPRSGEAEGVQHYFVDLETFNQMLADGDLLEHQEVHPGKFYGVPRQRTKDALDRGDLLIADVDIYGAQALKTAFPDNVITIFVLPTTKEVLRQRLLERGEADLEDRLRRAELELSHADEFDHQIVNDVLDHSIEMVSNIVQQTLAAA
ncbi:MAG: guanylate kinase [Anaerolineae bacterium]|nr:guanylate kinase [Anaerolineae bacterium]